LVVGVSQSRPVYWNYPAAVLDDMPGNPPFMCDAIPVESSVFKSLNRDGRGGIVMVCEGAMALLPATLSESPCSEGSKEYIRNAEAEGSSPFTSTKGQFTGLKWDPQEVAERRGRYVGFVAVVGRTQFFLKVQVKPPQRRPAFRTTGRQRQWCL